ncbi:lytic transglycosylase domain-containing protein [Rhodobacteraceae bacterium NNCM2]|nr:lytic transglycosylase domain-containing protein [Coraliihabitans acroporae]
MLALFLFLPPMGAAALDRHALVRERQMDASQPAPPASMPSGPVSSDWFWNEISPAIHPDGPARWNDALRTIEAARLSGQMVFDASARVQRIAKRWGPILKREAAKRNVSLPLLIAVIAVESGGNPRAISPKGAGGLMQLMPFTARRFGVRNSLAPAQNIRGGARYLSWLLERFEEDPVLALAGYNAGEGAVEKYGGVPPYRETRDYVPMVAAAFTAATRLCTTPSPDARQECKLK